MKMTESCGQSYGLYQVAYDILEEMGLGTDYWQSRLRAAFDRPCTSPRRSQCRSGGAPMKPQGWGPNDGWFCWPGADDPERFLKYGRWW
jgi:hypothetical protein